tara:strand:- start:127 stop:234 length:108 start_codon:yes stop_codon:yes gene_type:complete
MKKVKLYDPIKNNTWIMMFGFECPKNNKYKRKWSK